MYSAKRVGGKRLYELAREGKTVERKPCEITIYNIELLKVNIAERELTIKVDCSKGTYIRTLCKDIGEDLGCKAAMKSLLRTKTGDFSLEGSHKLDDIEKIVKEGRLEDILIPVETIFKNLPKINISGYADILLENGGVIKMDALNPGSISHIKNGDKFRMYNKDEKFKAIYSYDDNIKGFKIDKMF